MSFETSDRIFMYSMFFTILVQLNWLHIEIFPPIAVIGLSIIFYPLYRGFKTILKKFNLVEQSQEKEN